MEMPFLLSDAHVRTDAFVSLSLSLYMWICNEPIIITNVLLSLYQMSAAASALHGAPAG